MSDTIEKLYSEDNIDVTTCKCPNCNGTANFDPTWQKMKCEYCGSIFDMPREETHFVVERKLSELISGGEVWHESEVYQCESCGAKEIVNSGEVSHVCAFCGTKNVIKLDELPGLKPQGIVPFKINKEKAGQNAIKFAKKKFYAPRKFKKSAKPENLHGVYNPVFTFDAMTTSFYQGRLAKNYVTYRYVNGKRIADTKTRYFYIGGTQDLSFDDLIVQASNSIPSDMLSSLEPFSTKSSIEYRPEYLLGYGANTYNKSGEDCWKDCQEKMRLQIERAILKKYDYDQKVSLNVNTNFSNESYKYILVPIYVGHYTYKNKLYNFYVNGENGKVAGNTPVSKTKVGMTVFIVLLIIGVIILLTYLF